jgi:hypothetical protein
MELNKCLPAEIDINCFCFVARERNKEEKNKLIDSYLIFLCLSFYAVEVKE